MSERMIEQRRAMLLAKTNSSAMPPNGTSSNPSTPRQAAAQAMRSEDAQMSRFLRLLQETRDDGQPGEAVFGPTVPTSLSRRELHRQGVGFADTAVAAVVSAAGDRFLASVLQQSIPCQDQRLAGVEKARQAARERKRFRQSYDQDIDQRKRRKLIEATKRDAANRAAIRNAEELENKQNTAKRKAQNESDANSDTTKQQKTSAVANGMQQQGKIEVPDIEYDSLDEEDKRFIDHYAAHDDNGDDDDKSDDEEEEEVLILDDIARPLRSWGFHVDGKLTSDILASLAPPADVVNEPNATVPDGDGEDNADGRQMMNGGLSSEIKDEDNDTKEKSIGTPSTAKNGTPTKGGTPPKGVDSGNTAKTKSPSTTT